MDVVSLWESHRSASWPKFLSPHEGELMTLDTVISGCATYYMDERGLDPRRVQMLEQCVAELDGLLSDVPEEAGEYFTRLRVLAGTLLDTAQRTRS